MLQEVCSAHDQIVFLLFRAVLVLRGRHFNMRSVIKVQGISICAQVAGIKIRALKSNCLNSGFCKERDCAHEEKESEYQDTDPQEDQ